MAKKRPTAREPSKPPKTLRELHFIACRWVPFWRDRLGLRDWLIDVEYADAFDMAGNGPRTMALGRCIPSFPERKAKLRLLSPAAVDGGWHEDPERIIVHELLHIHFGTLGVSLGSYSLDRVSKTVMAEQVINALTTALVNARRGML